VKEPNNRQGPLSLKEKIGLYIIVGLTALMALLATAIIRYFMGIFGGGLGVTLSPPPPPGLALASRTVPFWLLAPLLLLGLHLWSVWLQRDRRRTHWVWFVVVLGSMLALILMVLALWFVITVGP